MPLNAGPTAGFWSKMKAGMPGALNQLGQQYGGQFSGAAKMTGAIMDARKKDKEKTQTQNGPQGMSPSGPSPVKPPGGMVRGPSFGNPGLFTGGGFGGMTPSIGGNNPSMAGGMMQPMPVTPNVPPMAGPGPGMQSGNLWGAYGQLSNQTPSRQLFY